MSDPAACSPPDDRSFTAHLGPLLFLIGIFLVNFLARILLTPLLAKVEADLGLDHAQAGGLFFLITLGYFPGLVGVGFLQARLDHRRVIIISGPGGRQGACLILLSAAQNLFQVRLGLLLMGLASGFYLSSGLATLISWSSQSTGARP